MKQPATGAAIAGLGILLVNGAVAAEAAPAAPVAADAASHSTVALDVACSPNLQSEISVSSAQLAAYNSLSSSLRNKLSGEDTQVALQRPCSTIMCPW